jgi:hypothetical protein
MFKRIIILVGAVALSCVGLATAPAHASTNGALSRCNSFQASDHFASVVVPGTGSTFVGGGPRQSINTPLRNMIRPGDVVGIAASGQVGYGGFFGSAGTWGPNGNGRTAPLNSNYPFPSGPQYALVGTWNHTAVSNSRVRIGSVSACMVVPPGGDGVSLPWGLWLWPNDDNRGNNAGSYRANVHVWAADRSP